MATLLQTGRQTLHPIDFSDILPTAKFPDSVAWSLAVGQHVPRQEEELDTECVLDVLVDTMAGSSFQETLVRLPIRLQSFGLRSLAVTTLTAFIGGVELEEGRWRRAGGLL